MRNAGKEDRRRERAVASLGKHYPFPTPSPTPSPSPSPSSTASGTPSPSPSPTFAFRVSTPVETASPGTTVAQSVHPRHPEILTANGSREPWKPIAQAGTCNDCLDLMHSVMAYRHEPIHSELMKIRDKYSMLHVDVLILVYHFAKLCSGAILEIGAFVGGATIAAAVGVRDSGQEKKLIAVEPGGSVKHKTARYSQYLARLGTKSR